MKQGKWTLAAGLLAAVFLLAVGCGNRNEEIKNFIVEEDYQIYTVADRFSYDIRMPRVADNVADSDIINRQIALYDERKAEDWPENQSEEEQGETLVYIQRTYLVSNQEGVCSLTILTRWVPSAEGAERGFSIKEEAVSFYYDENRGRAVNQEEYLALLEMSKAQLLSAFKEEYGGQYSDRAYTADDLMWYFNEHDNLLFVTSPLDNMAVEDSEFILTVGDVPFGLNGNYEFPEERARVFDTAFEEEVQSGPSWQTEQYDGVRITYVADGISGERRLYEAAVTRLGHTGYAALLAEREREQQLAAELEGEAGEAPPVDEALTVQPISTYRGVGVGDAKSAVLRLYPEIDEEEQAASYGSSDILVFTEGAGGRTLEFHFTEDTVSQIVLKYPL